MSRQLTLRIEATGRPTGETGSGRESGQAFQGSDGFQPGNAPWAIVDQR